MRGFICLVLGTLLIGLASCTGVPTTKKDVFADYQRTLRARGLLRTDTRPADVPYTNAELADHFRRIAFFSYPDDAEYIPKPLTRWEGPVRYVVVGGQDDEAQIASFMTRLSNLTGLEIARVPDNHPDPNYFIFILDDDEQTMVVENWDDEDDPLLDDLFSRIVDCGGSLVWEDRNPEIVAAIILVHGDLAGLYKEVCYHEEFSQSLGLMSDDPEVRPSIFNDDDEFALLTEHDELLIRILYDPRLRIGMRPAEAMPIVEQIIEELRPGR